MGGPEKPFSCPELGCGAYFTTEDGLAAHSKKHDMVLHLGCKAGTFVADQTPTPTRFIRNCEEVGLFQDLQNVNPFDETFKRAMENRIDANHVNNQLLIHVGDDTLHTPHIFPNIPEDTSNNQFLCKENQNELIIDHISANNVAQELGYGKESVNNIHGSQELKNGSAPKKSEKIHPKLKLTRQYPIDSLENETSPIIIKTIVPPVIKNNVSLADGIVDKSKENELDNFKKTNVPFISITDVSESVISEAIHDKSISLTATKYIESSSNQKSLEDNIKKTILLNKPGKQPTISQKSIEMVLTNFTNELHHKVDLGGISIEDIPTMNDIKEASAKIDSIETVSTKIMDASNTFPIIQDDVVIISNSITQNTLEDKILNDKQYPSNSFGKNPPVENNRYELVLKCPGGKKVYLKEVFREDNVQNETPKLNDTIIHQPEPLTSSGIKRKLKENIENNTRHNSNLNLFLKNNSTNLMNSIILPQPIVLKKSAETPVLLNYNASDVLQHKTVTGPTVQSQINNIEMTTMVQDQKIYKSNLVPKTSVQVNNNVPHMQNAVISNTTYNLSGPILINNSKQLVISNSKKLPPKTTKRKVVHDDVSAEADPKILDIRQRNSAAVGRYRRKQKVLLDTLSEKNKKLEIENARLKLELDNAIEEIKRLQHIIISNRDSNVNKTIR